MADRVGFISRRKLLQMGSLAPFAVLVFSGASHAQIVESCKDLDNVPQETLDYLYTLATSDGSAVDKTHFQCVVKMLWFSFELGAGKPKFSDAEKRALLEAAFNKQTSTGEISGRLIVLRLPTWDPDGNHSATNICAFACGRHAAAIAAKKGVSIDVPIFRLAWNKTELEMTGTLDRARAIAKAQGREADLRILGNGC